MDHFLTQSCLVLYSLCANLLDSLIMRLIISSLSPTLSILLRLIYCWYWYIDIIGPFYVVLGCYYKRLSFSQSFSSLATSKFSRVRFRLFVAWKFHAVIFLSIFVCKLFLFFWSSSCLYCFLRSSVALFMYFSIRDYYQYYCEFFHTSVSLWPFMGGWGSTCLLRSPGHVSVFLPISTML